MMYALAGLCGVLLVLADQLTKAYIMANFTLAESVPFINGLIDFTYVHNKGGAWGLMSGYTWVLLALTILIMIVCIAMLMKNGFKSKLLFWSVSLIIAGGIGNMIDRIFRNGNVVDFIHLHFMPSFPVFNLADCAVCIGALLLLLYFVIDILRDTRTRKERENALKEIKLSAQNAEEKQGPEEPKTMPSVQPQDTPEAAE